MPRKKSARKYLLTINNPQTHGFDHARIRSILSDFPGIDYWCMCDETGEQGTYHTHIYAAFRNSVMFDTVRSKFYGAHIDPAKGKHRENRDYIRKEGKWADTDKADTRVEGSFKEFGTIPDESEEKAPRMAQLMKHIQEGLSNVEILQIDPSYGFKIREMDQLRQQLLNDKYIRENRKVTVHYLYGDSGTGKTRSIFEKHPATDICRITSYPPRGNVLFDSYKGQPVLVFEEFHSQISISDMLNFLDIYPVMLPARYYDRVACYTTVYITSNIPLEEQYPEIQKCKLETWKAFLRRIHTVTEFRKGGIIREVKNEEPE